MVKLSQNHDFCWHFLSIEATGAWISGLHFLSTEATEAWISSSWLGGSVYYIRGTLKWLADVFAQLKAWWIRTRNICPHCLGGEEMPTKVIILAQFGHGYYIRETLKRLTGVLAWPKAWWICLSVKRVTDSKSMPLLPQRRRNAHKSHDFGSVWPWILYPWDFEEVDGCFGLAHGLVDPFVILAQFDHGYYIHGTLKWLTSALPWPKGWWICVFWLASELGGSLWVFWLGPGIGESVYYICGTLKWLMVVLAWLNAWWICTRNPCPSCLVGEEMPAKVVILAQFDHGYYIRETLKRLTDVVAWLKAWWICVSVKQVTDQKSMPLLPRWGGKVVILAQFGRGYYIRGTSKCLTGVLAWLRASWIKSLEYLA
ncbi:hypothetical protein C8R44DRAFT_738188 [Mycena epipterygia]|nr:hypothetical protein C8R44DRAFT_738188 [Mycena epipterygia]